MPTTPAISLIIPAHNEEFTLPACLDSIFAAGQATGRPFEVIVVNDASTDRTAEVAAAAGAKVVTVNLRKISAVRNAGAQAAAGPILVFVDADTVLPAATLQAALAALAGGAVGGGAMVRFDQGVGWGLRLAIWGFCQFYMRLCRWAAGCFVYVRRDAFAAVGGFDERYFASEEVVLSKALKQHGRFVVVPQRVITSGRKARMFSVGKLLWISLRIILGGQKALQRREGLDLWYQCGREQGQVGAKQE